MWMTRVVGLLCTVLLAALPLTACNTMRGLGEDLQAAGKGVQSLAEEKGADPPARPRPYEDSR